MARRVKRRVKQRSKAHRKWVKSKAQAQEEGASERRLRRQEASRQEGEQEVAATDPVGLDDHARGGAPHPVDRAVVAHVQIAEGLLARRRRRQRDASGLPCRRASRRDDGERLVGDARRAAWSTRGRCARRRRRGRRRRRRGARGTSAARRSRPSSARRAARRRRRRARRWRGRRRDRRWRPRRSGRRASGGRARRQRVAVGGAVGVGERQPGAVLALDVEVAVRDR